MTFSFNVLTYTIIGQRVDDDSAIFSKNDKTFLQED